MTRARVYIVPLTRWGTGDISGLSVAADRIWFQHVSSSLDWLARDTTTGFPDRARELEAAYPDGFDVVPLALGQALPDDIAHHFERAAAARA